MQLFQHTLAFTSEEDTVLAIGKFDGLHMGHKKLLDVVRREKEKGLKSAIFTFDMAPLDVITHHTTKLLTTNDEKHEIFEAIGIDYFIECPFVDEIRLLEPEDFIRMMVEKMRVKVFVVGTDCRFAHDRKGNCEVLRSYADQYGYRVDVVQKKQYESRDISSTFVREEIEKGNIGKANMLLGYPYFVQGEVLGGNRIGHTIGFPTINQTVPTSKILPPYGVYVSQVNVDEKMYRSITNIGVKPTVSGEDICGVETHILGYSGDLYGRFLRVELLSYIRPERRFSSLDALKMQIGEDVNIALNFANVTKILQ